MTKEHLKEISKKGGIASAKARAERKAISNNVRAILDLKPNQKEMDFLIKNEIADDDPTKNEIVALSLYLQAVKGNMKAIDIILKIQDEKESKPKNDTIDIIKALNDTAKAVWK